MRGKDGMRVRRGVLVAAASAMVGCGSGGSGAGAVCGNGSCEPGESAHGCPADCVDTACAEPGDGRVDGTVRGRDVAPVRQAHVFEGRSDSGDEVWVVLDEASGTCDEGGGDGMSLHIEFPCGTAPGVYSVPAPWDGCAGDPFADARLRSDGNLRDAFAAATAGTVTLTSTDDCFRGTFELTFGEEGTMTGSFTALRCAPPIDAGVDAPPIDAAVDAPPDAPTDAPPDAPTDAAIDAVGTTCDPLAPPGQAGCGAGEKCTWVVLQGGPPPLGRVTCVPDGTVPLGGACVRGAPGEQTGFDNCVDGGICASGTCRDVCGFDGGPNSGCPAGNTCTRFAGLFGNPGEDQVAGGCMLDCNPVTQNPPCPAGQGCYIISTTTNSAAVCAGAGTLGQGQEIVPPVFVNSCRPGYMPRPRSPGSNVWECGALCRPTDVTSTMNQPSEGGVAPYTCAARGAALPGDPVNGESCRYWWAREPLEGLSMLSNTVGWCFRHAAYQYDTNMDGVADAPFPPFINVTTGDVLPPIGNPPHNDAIWFWCAALPSQKPIRARPVAHAPPPTVDRLTAWR